MLESTRAKYLNMLLAEIAERAIEHRQMSWNMKRSPRDRAISKVLAAQFGSLYNFARTQALLIEPDFEGKLLNQWGKNKKESIDWDVMLEMNGSLARPLTPEEIDEILLQAFNVTKQERVQAQKSVETTLLAYLDENPDIAQRVTENLKLIQNSQINRAKGNPRLGGFTRAMIAKGFVPEVAKIEAQKQLDEIQIKDRSEEIRNNRNIQEVIAKVLKDDSKNQTSEQELWNMLKSEPSEPEITNTLANSDVKDFSDFDDPENLN